MEHKEDPTKEKLRELGFGVSSVLPELIDGLRFRAHTVRWMRIPHYSLLKDVLAQMEAEEVEPAHRFDFIGTLLSMHPIIGSRVCLIKKPDGTWGHLAATQYGEGPSSERSLVSIMSGDGFGPNCHFAVVSKGAR